MKKCIPVAVVVILGLFMTVGCGQSQDGASSGVSEDVATTKETILPIIGEAPEFELTNYDGNRIKLSEFRGKVVMITFFYTSCPDDVCQLQNMDFLAVYHGLSEEARQNIVLISMTFDPEVDTPEVLDKYVKSRGLEFQNWYFLTGGMEEVIKTTDVYGVSYELIPAEEETHSDGTVHQHDRAFRHLSQLIIIDQDGMIRSQYLGIRINAQVLPREAMLEDVNLLLATN